MLIIEIATGVFLALTTWHLTLKYWNKIVQCFMFVVQPKYLRRGFETVAALGIAAVVLFVIAIVHEDRETKKRAEEQRIAIERICKNIPEDSLRLQFKDFDECVLFEADASRAARFNAWLNQMAEEERSRKRRR